VAPRRLGFTRGRARLLALLVAVVAALVVLLLLTRSGPAADCTHGESSISMELVDGRPVVTGPEQTGCRLPENEGGAVPGPQTG
jgi:hypothetical protein